MAYCAASHVAVLGAVFIAAAEPAVGQRYTAGGNADPAGAAASKLIDRVPSGDRKNRQVAINACAEAAQIRLGSDGYARVLGISSATRQRNGGMSVRGVATSGRYNEDTRTGRGRPVDLSWQCDTDTGGYIRNLVIEAQIDAYGRLEKAWDDDYSEFGYRRY